MTTHPLPTVHPTPPGWSHIEADTPPYSAWFTRLIPAALVAAGVLGALLAFWRAA